MVELRPAVGVQVATGEQIEHTYDSIVVDGVTIGISFRYENRVHWHYKKKSLPKPIIKRAVKLLMDRNSKAGELLNDKQRRDKIFIG